MALPTASDNAFPKLLVVEQGSTPASPGAGNQKLFIRTSDHTLCYVNSSGTVTQVGAGSGMTNPMTTKGDVILGDTGGTPTRLAAGATAGMVLTSAGSGAFETFSLPPGYEFDYVEITTASISITATTEGTANTIVTANAVSYDGSTKAVIHFFCGRVEPPASGYLWIALYDGASSIGQWGLQQSGSTGGRAMKFEYRLTPSNASHTYSVRGFVGSGTGTIYSGAAGSGNQMPTFIRQTKV